ncbi:TetR/AcrR family transcriptional regulator [Microbacterium stercoris]|uniref:TetR/AcrR family transcriptional regulator n=1 Tax=Microbacterium stercoris TaxID=2820289 RepID=A0A939TM91_9MICO|nr:TetR/AcrR family transcriptional regulator [Microbacterium stercoris]MBO3662953.1 TetR/AcrR family transcriptional regulator [Microbacterium stercoris]
MTTVEPGTTRSRRSGSTRAAIVAAAREEFIARGYRATSLREIAAAAGISHPGLLGHFATRGELLAEVVATFEEQNRLRVLERAAAAEPGILGFSEIARDNERVPGYLALFAALTGEASTTRHPAHALMRDRYARLLEMCTDAMEDAVAHDAIAADRDPREESVRVVAAWDGLQVLEQYLPRRVDVASALETYEDLLALPRGWREDDGPRGEVIPQPLPTMALAQPDAPPVGYRTGRQRREQVLASAMQLFARDGYGDTSLREVAEHVGVSKSTLLHYFSSKEELLRAVLTERDRLIEQVTTDAHPTRAADVLRALPTGAAHNAAHEPGLIEVYAVLSCEAVPAGHVAHEYFETRLASATDYFADLFRAAQADGDLPAHRDPEFEAAWLVALWDGLQYQWLYDRESIDVAAHLIAHLDDVLPRR